MLFLPGLPLVLVGGVELLFLVEELLDLVDMLFLLVLGFWLPFVTFSFLSLVTKLDVLSVLSNSIINNL